MPSQFDPPSGTRDFLAADVEQREHAFTVIRDVFSRYGFEPLQTPAFERLDVLLGKYGDESDKLVFKILRRGEHEATGEADLALRYDMTVPLARVVAAYGSQLPMPYKRYALGPVWRADRPGKDRYREFVQCDLDTLGSTSLLADAETLSAQHDALAELGLPDFTIQLNSRLVLAGMQEAFAIPPDLSAGVLISLDKLDKLPPGAVVAELTDRGLAPDQAAELVAALTAPDAVDRVRVALAKTDEGTAGLDRGRHRAVAAVGPGAGRAHRLHAAPGARAELLHRADLGGRRARALPGRSAPAAGTTTCWRSSAAQMCQAPARRSASSEFFRCCRGQPPTGRGGWTSRSP